MKKRLIASVLTAAMIISSVSPLSAYADQGKIGENQQEELAQSEEVLEETEEDVQEEWTEESPTEEIPEEETGDPKDEEGDVPEETEPEEDEIWLNYDDELVEECEAEPVAYSTGIYTLDQLRQKYPDGKYWNHVGMSGNNADSYTSTPCSNHNNVNTCNAYVRNGSKWAWQCMGYAYQIGYYYTGLDPVSTGNGWGYSKDPAAIDNLKTGDIVRYKDNYHSIFITGVDGETVYYTDCNSDSHCKIKWDQVTTKSVLRSSFTNVRIAPGNPVPVPSCGCSEEYSGWYVVKAGGVNVNSSHNFSSYLTEFKGGDYVYVTKASGTGSGKIGHINYNGQECYVAMNLLTKLTGAPVGSSTSTAMTGYSWIYGYAFDWDSTDTPVRISIEMDNGDEVSGYADQYIQPDYNNAASFVNTYGAVTDEKYPGLYHGFRIKVYVPANVRTMKVYAYGTDDNVPTLLKTVDVIVLQSITITSQPNRMDYTVGDTLDTTGLVLKGYYSGTVNGTPRNTELTITSGFTCSPTVLNTAGQQVITVSYDGRTTTYTVNVEKKEEPEPSEPEQPSKPSEPEQPTKPSEPANPTPEAPSAPAVVDGGDGGGMAILLGGVVALIGGIVVFIRSLPVRVSGTVLYKNEALANTTVELMQSGQVIEKIVTDANGRFGAQVKRGDYTLRVMVPQEDGSTIPTEREIKAPCTNVAVIF